MYRRPLRRAAESLKILSLHLSGGTVRHSRKSSLRIVCMAVAVRTGYLRDKSRSSENLNVVTLVRKWGDMAILKVRKDFTLLGKMRDMVIPKVRKHVTLIVEKEDMAVLKVLKSTRY